MKYYAPTTIYQDRNCVQKYSRQWTYLGNKALIVTGKHSSKINGSLDDVRFALKASNTQFVVFDEIEENPTANMVVKAAEVGITENCDFVIGIGGGSALDASKAAAFLLYKKKASADILFSMSEDNKCPLICIPTTCGTGAEVTPNAVLTREATKTKGSIPHKLFPDIALIDAKYISRAPLTVLRNTAMDTLAHLIESYINTNANIYSKMLVEEGLEIWARSKDVLLGIRRPNESDYEYLMVSANLAGMAIAQTGTSIPHGLSYYLTVDYGISHGVAAGYFLASYLNEADERCVNTILKASGFNCVMEIDDFYKKICDVPTLSEEYLENCFDQILLNKTKVKNCPFSVDKKIMKKMIENILRKQM